MSHNKDRFCNDVKAREITELILFCTGDASPSHFLHSACQLLGDLINRLSNSERYCSCSSRKTMLYVYRHLPPDVHSPLPCLERPYVGCLWESYLENVKDVGPKPQAKPLSVMKHRMVSPPYLSHATEYPALLDALLESLDSLRREVNSTMDRLAQNKSLL